MDQGLHRLHLVINTFKEDRLIAQRYSREGKTLASFFECPGALPRVIYMKAHPYRAVFSKDVAEILGDALGQKNGDTRADSDKFDVVNGTQSTQ
jgi:hypothetical protein